MLNHLTTPASKTSVLVRLLFDRDFCFIKSLVRGRTGLPYYTTTLGIYLAHQVEGPGSNRDGFM